MIKKKKQPSDYGQFYFRIPKDEQELIEDEIQELLAVLKARTSENDLVPKRNELILRALRRGLKIISKEIK